MRDKLTRLKQQLSDIESRQQLLAIDITKGDKAVEEFFKLESSRHKIEAEITRMEEQKSMME